MSIESFGAVVSDNDGSAFITKAEFDSMKNEFQSQIDQYNTSIDAKIDGAIASYLAGLQISIEQQRTPYFIENAGTAGKIKFMDNSNVPYVISEHGFEIKLGLAIRMVSSSIIRGFCGSILKTGLNNGRRVMVKKYGTDKWMWAGYYVNYHTDYDFTLGHLDTQNRIANDVPWALNVPMLNSKPDVIYDKDNIGAAFIYSTQADTTPITDLVYHLSYNWNVSRCTFTGTHNGDLQNVYDAMFSDAEYDAGTFDINDMSKLICRSEFCLTNGYTFRSINLSSDSAGTYNSGTTKPSYNGPYAPGFADGATWGINVRDNLYGFSQAPVFYGTWDWKTKWSNIMYNDTRTYTYKTNVGSETMSGYSMVAGLPLIDVLKDEKITWQYEFENASTDRKIYVKYGEFDGTNITGEKILEFNANNKIGTIEFEATENNIIFVKWTKGETLLASGSGKLTKTSQS